MLVLTQTQKHILKAVHSGYNCRVDAKPGASKTTLALLLYQETKEHDFLFLTYNRNLADETNEELSKLKQFQPKTRKAGVFTYHGLLTSLTRQTVQDDLTFLEVLNSLPEKELEAWPLNSFTILVIDEAQDIRPPFWSLITFLVSKIALKPEEIRWIDLGQSEQMIYDYYAYNRADIRFFEQMERLTNLISPRPWLTFQMCESFRLSPQIANTTNLLFPSKHPIIGCNHSGPPVQLHICHVYIDAVRILLPYIEKILQEETTFILCPSANAKSPLIKVVNAFIARGRKVYVTRSGSLSESCPRSTLSFTKGKDYAGTFHSSKGLQADNVFIINTGELFGSKNNALYVALSRPKRSLIIVQESRFITEEMLQTFANLSKPEDVTIHVHRNLPLKQAKSKFTPKPKLSKNNNNIVKDITNDTNNANDDNDMATSLTSQNSQDFISDIAATATATASHFKLEELFAFMDVHYIVELLQYLTIQPLQNRFVSTVYDLPEENKKDDSLMHMDILSQKQVENYANDMVVTTKNKEHHISVLSYVGDCMIMALELLLKLRLPHILFKMHSSMPPSHDYFNRMIELVQKVQEGLEQLAQNKDKQYIQLLLPTLVEIIAMNDAFHGFADRYALLKGENYQFVTKPSVFIRLDRLFENIFFIQSKYKTNLSIQFHQLHECRISIQSDDSILKYHITGTATLTLGDRAVISIVHTPIVGSEHRLIAAALAETAHVPDAYLINSYDGSLEKLSLHNRLEFLGHAVYAKTQTEPDVVDELFFQQHTIQPIVACDDDFVPHDQDMYMSEVDD